MQEYLFFSDTHGDAATFDLMADLAVKLKPAAVMHGGDIQDSKKLTDGVLGPLVEAFQQTDMFKEVHAKLQADNGLSDEQKQEKLSEAFTVFSQEVPIKEKAVLLDSMYLPAAEAVEKITASGCTFYYVLGNHDTQNARSLLNARGGINLETIAHDDALGKDVRGVMNTWEFPPAFNQLAGILGDQAADYLIDYELGDNIDDVDDRVELAKKDIKQFEKREVPSDEEHALYEQFQKQKPGLDAKHEKELERLAGNVDIMLMHKYIHSPEGKETYGVATGSSAKKYLADKNPLVLCGHYHNWYVDLTGDRPVIQMDGNHLARIITDDTGNLEKVIIGEIRDVDEDTKDYTDEQLAAFQNVLNEQGYIGMHFRLTD